MLLFYMCDNNCILYSQIVGLLDLYAVLERKKQVRISTVNDINSRIIELACTVCLQMCVYSGFTSDRSDCI